MSRFVRCMAQQRSILNGQKLLASKLLTPSVTATQQRGLLTTKKEFNRDLLAYIQQEIDLRPIAIRRWKKRKEWEMLKKDNE